MFLGYIVLQVFCIYSFATGTVILPVKYVLYFYIIIITYLLTHSMEQSPSWEANQW
jgi:hypothetical protein